MRKDNRSHIKGNALFLILIAITLFAALSYAVTRSSDGGGGINKEKLVLEAAKFLQYMGAIDNAVQRLILINGCAATELSFNHDDWTSGNPGSNLNSPADKSCHVFDPNGGGVTFKFYAEQSVFADIVFDGVGSTCTNSNCSELYYTVRFHHSGTAQGSYSEQDAIKLCTIINKKLYNLNTIPSLSDLTHTFWDGSFGYDSVKTHADTIGRRNMCVKESVLITSYYHVLVQQ